MVENVGKDRLQKSVKHSTAKRLQNDRKTALSEAYAKLTQSLREAYGCSMISKPVRHLELSTNKGTKNVRETSDIEVWW